MQYAWCGRLVGGLLAIVISIVPVLAADGYSRERMRFRAAAEKTVFPSDAAQFQYEYESLNNTVRADGVLLWPVALPEDNPFIYVTEQEAVELANNGTGVLFIGDGACRVCRMMATLLVDAVSDERALGNPYVSRLYYLNPGLLDESGQAYRELAQSVLKPLGDYLQDYRESYTNIYGTPALIEQKAVIGNPSDAGEYKYTAAFYYEGLLLGVIVGTTSHFVDSNTPPTEADKEEFCASFWKLAGLFGTDLCNYC